MIKEREQWLKTVVSDNTHGKRIYLLGSAEYGPVNEPILIKSTVGFHSKFGTKGTLVSAFHAIKYTSKANQVYVVKVTGEHAKCTLSVNNLFGEVTFDGLVLTSSQANEIFNDIKIVVNEDSLMFRFPEDLNINDIIYKYADYPYMDLLVEAINKDTKNRKSFIYAYHNVASETPTQYAFYGVNPSMVYLEGGNSGLNYSKNELYSCLSSAYNILESHSIDIIVPVDAFLDDMYPDMGEDSFQYNKTYYHHDRDYLTEDNFGRKRSFMNQLIDFCIIQLNFGMVTNGILGFNSNYQYWCRHLSEADDLAKMYQACIKYNLSVCNNAAYSFMVSVVGGDLMYNKGTIIDNGYLAYAALCANTLYLEGTTNIPISKTLSIYHEFSEDILSNMADSGIVVFRHSPLYNTPVVYDGITPCNNENFRLYCNVRMIQICISMMNQLFQYYIGHDMIRIINKNILEKDLDNLLKVLRAREIITAYKIKLEHNYIEGHITVYLSLMTNYMVKAVTVCSVVDVTRTEGDYNE